MEKTFELQVKVNGCKKWFLQDGGRERV